MPARLENSGGIALHATALAAAPGALDSDAGNATVSRVDVDQGESRSGSRCRAIPNCSLQATPRPGVASATGACDHVHRSATARRFHSLVGVVVVRELESCVGCHMRVRAGGIPSGCQSRRASVLGIDLAGGAIVFLAFVIFFLVAVIQAVYSESGSGIAHHPYRHVHGGAPGAAHEGRLAGADRDILRWSRGTR
jgi:hypothetical protein